jgi:hypothetical protein
MLQSLPLNSLTYLLERDAQPASLLRGRVLEVREDGSVLVAGEDEPADRILCELLQTSDGLRLHLASGDTVFLWRPPRREGRGVVLGRLGPSLAAVLERPDVPEELVIEASQQLTLKCGEGSITLRGDGKVLIKGKDLVSHAQRMNRIKGGGVAIN